MRTAKPSASVPTMADMAQPPAGIRPVSQEAGGWRPLAPLPLELREASLPPMTDPATLLRCVTGAVVSVSAAMRHLSAALAAQDPDDAQLGRAMAALNAAVADQSITARAVLKRLYDDTAA